MSIRTAPASPMARAVARRSSASGCTEPGWKDSGLTLRTPMTPTGRPLPRDTPARTARPVTPSREPLRARSGFLEGTCAENAGNLLAVEGLALEQGTRQRVEFLDVLLEDLLGTARGVHHDPLDLAVDQEGGLLAVVLLPGYLAAEEDVLLVLAEGERPELVGHAPLTDHLAGPLRG